MVYGKDPDLAMADATADFRKSMNDQNTSGSPNDAQQKELQ